MEAIHELITSYNKDGWQSNPFEKMLDIVTKSPDYTSNLIKEIVTNLPEGSTFLDASFLFLPYSKWTEVVEHAISTLQTNPENTSAQSVIDYASLQAPHVLYPYLETIFSLAPNEGSYYENRPWKGSGEFSFKHLSRTLSDTNADSEARSKAWHCLLECRDTKSMQFAIDRSEIVGIAKEEVNDYLHTVGYELIDNQLKQLHQANVYHLIYPDKYLSNDGPIWLDHSKFPTWRADSDHANLSFGGAADANCNSCGNAGHQIICLTPMLNSLSIVTIEKLNIRTCLSCLGWEHQTMYYKHQEDGTSLCLADKISEPPGFPSEEFKSTKVGAARLHQRWACQDWGGANSRENLHRIGGHPTWIQDAQYPGCTQCNSTMMFLMQLDSELPTEDQDEFLWGSGGIAYIFWCDQCKISALLGQWT